MNKQSDTPEVLAALDKCQADISAIIGKPVLVSWKVKHKSIATHDLIRIVTDVCEVPWHIVLSKTRKRSVVLARHLFIYFALTIQKKTLRQVMETISACDHSTVIHARQHIESMIDTDDDYYMPFYRAIEERIQEVIL